MRRKWALRKVRNGRVKIGGVWYVPKDHHREYKGECDGGWYLFCRYFVGETTELYVSLWGSKEYADATTAEEMDAARHTNRNEIDGVIYWQFWQREKPSPARAD